jgi:hypothetical protein
MKKTWPPAALVILALVFNIEWEWSPSPMSQFWWGGPESGIAVCVIICFVLIYRGFLAFQDFLVRRSYLPSRVTTAVDLLPWIVLLPIATTYVYLGEGWSFRWGDSGLRFWYFIALVVTVFMYQIYTLMRRVAENTKQP